MYTPFCPVLTIYSYRIEAKKEGFFFDKFNKTYKSSNGLILTIQQRLCQIGDKGMDHP